MLVFITCFACFEGNVMVDLEREEALPTKPEWRMCKSFVLVSFLILHKLHADLLSCQLFLPDLCEQSHD